MRKKAKEQIHIDETHEIMMTNTKFEKLMFETDLKTIQVQNADKDIDSKANFRLKTK